MRTFARASRARELTKWWRNEVWLEGVGIHAHPDWRVALAWAFRHLPLLQQTFDMGFDGVSSPSLSLSLYLTLPTPPILALSHSPSLATGCIYSSFFWFFLSSVLFCFCFCTRELENEYSQLNYNQTAEIEDSALNDETRHYTEGRCFQWFFHFHLFISFSFSANYDNLYNKKDIKINNCPFSIYAHAELVT